MDQPEETMDILEFISSLAWPLLLLFALVRYHGFLSGFLSKVRSVKFKVFDQEIELSAEQAEETLQEIAEDVVSLIDDMSQEQRDLYVKIRALDGTKTVKEILPDFVRGSYQHQLLQALRERKLIRPLEGSSWRDEKRPVVTRFSRLVERIYPDLVRGKLPNKPLQPIARKTRSG